MKQLHLLLSASLLCSILINVPLEAQNSSIEYDLSDYKLPYLKRHVLEFNFNLGANYYSQRSQIDDNDPEKSSDQRFSTTILPVYYYYLNSDKFQIIQQVSANIPNIYLNSRKDDYFNRKSFDMSPSINYSGEFREYLSGKLFLEQDVLFNYTNSFNRSHQENNNNIGEIISIIKQDETLTDIKISIPILIGWGRIERVEDARLAVYILDDLNKAGKLAREVTQEDIHELSIRISEVQNERLFDSREKKIWELEQINSFLLEKGLIDSEDIVYFTLLNDNWDYSAWPVRESGFRISGGISPELEFYKTVDSEDEEFPLSNTKIINENTSNNFSYSASASLVYKLL